MRQDKDQVGSPLDGFDEVWDGDYVIGERDSGEAKKR
jgi:hypothetical protein